MAAYAFHCCREPDTINLLPHRCYVNTLPQFAIQSVIYQTMMKLCIIHLFQVSDIWEEPAMDSLNVFNPTNVTTYLVDWPQVQLSVSY